MSFICNASDFERFSVAYYTMGMENKIFHKTTHFCDVSRSWMKRKVWFRISGTCNAYNALAVVLKVQEIFYLSRHLSFERHSEELFSVGLVEGPEYSYSFSRILRKWWWVRDRSCQQFNNDFDYFASKGDRTLVQTHLLRELISNRIFLHRMSEEP